MKMLVILFLLVGYALFAVAPALSENLPLDNPKAPPSTIKASGSAGLMFSANGKRLVLAGHEHFEVWDAVRNLRICGPIQHEGVVAISLNGDLIAYSGEADGGKTVLRVAHDTGKIIHQWDTGTPLDHVAFSPDGKHVVAVGPAAEARIWDVARGANFVLLNSKKAITCGFSPNGQCVYLNTADRVLSLYDAVTGKLMANPMRVSVAIESSSFKEDGGSLVIARGAGIEILAIPSLEKKTVLQTFGAIASYEAQWASQRVVVTSGSQARLYDLASGKQIGPVFGRKSLQLQARFRPATNQLIIEAQAGESGIWDVTTGRQLIEFKHEQWDLIPITATSADGKVIAVYFSDDLGTVIYNLPS